MFGKSIFFFYKAILFGIAAYAVIPRHMLKKYLLYGFIFGAMRCHSGVNTTFSGFNQVLQHGSIRHLRCINNLDTYSLDVCIHVIFLFSSC